MEDQWNRDNAKRGDTQGHSYGSSYKLYGLEMDGTELSRLVESVDEHCGAVLLRLAYRMIRVEWQGLYE